MRIDTSIQDFLRKINSRILIYLHPAEVVLLATLALSFLLFVITLSFLTKEERHVFVYREGKEEISRGGGEKSNNYHYFGAKSGKVYYASYCKAGARVKVANRVYFETVEEATRSGRVLSKLCE